MFVNLRCITTSDIEVLSDWKGGWQVDGLY